MKIACLSGWGQPADALSSIAPEAAHVAYAAHADLAQALTHIAEAAQDAELVIGWSMGGQMAVRAVAAGYIAPRRLVLIGTPFQFVRNEKLALGMGPDTHAQFRHNLVYQPTRAFGKSYALIAHGDHKADAVQSFLRPAPAHDWLYWLDAMADYSCADLDFSGFPPTLLIHGERDAVTGAEQSKAFHAALPRATLAILEGCGHAPHWHDPARVQHLITAHVQR